MRHAISALIALGLAAGPALATADGGKPPLREVREIDDGLLAVGIADEIRKECDDISARMFRALGYISSLERRARELGYTEDEIEDYVTSKEEKKRMRARGEAWLEAQGVNQSEPGALCALGRREIAKGSQIGALLKVK